jgi:hypothetical protein
MKKILYLVVVLATLVTVGFTQQTLMTVPSADVLDQGKAFVRADLMYSPSSASFTVAPNFVYGTKLFSRKTEVGVNIESFSKGNASTISIVPGAKVKLWEHTVNDNSYSTIYAGDKLYLPVYNRFGNAGNYFYAAYSTMLETGTRFTLGAYNQQNVYAAGNHSGALLGLEQTVHYRNDFADVIPQVDWQSGHGGNGYLSLGVQLFATKRLFILPSYALGNSSVGKGNHGATMYIGFNLN